MLGPMGGAAQTGVKSVRALARGLDVLRALRQRASASLQELHGDTGLAKPTLLRILKTLEEGGFVRRSLGDGRYRIGAAARLPGRDTGAHDAIAEQASPVLDRLCRDVLWPSDIGVYKGGAMEILETSRSLTPFLVNRSRMGYRVHMLMSALGRAYLAFCPPRERAAILSHLRQSGDPYDRRAHDEAAVRRDLERDRARGYAIRQSGYGHWASDRDQADAIAVPVLQGARVLASVNLTWVAGAVSLDDMVARHLDRLRAAAAEIAASLRAQQSEAKSGE
jgi:IclR family mhp operon transcriptional activator